MGSSSSIALESICRFYEIGRLRKIEGEESDEEQVMVHSLPPKRKNSYHSYDALCSVAMYCFTVTVEFFL